MAEENARRELEGKPPLKEGWNCEYCGTFVEKGKSVCVGCHAEVAYSATRQESDREFGIGLFLGMGIAGMLFLILPKFLNEKFDWSIPLGFGLGTFVNIVL